MQNSNPIAAERLTDIFERLFHATPKIFRAPGRVNLIGEHTDYNDGFVLPSAIGFYADVAISPRRDDKFVLRSTEFERAFEISADNLPNQKLGEWCDYVLGVAVELVRSHVELEGANLLVHGNVPIGAGLSSSAALEVASALAILSVTGKTMPITAVAQLCQKAENEFVRARVGIMDQFVSCHGQKGHAVLLDCRSLEFELVPIPEGVKFVICNTMIKHELAHGEYNRRREECEQGVKILSNSYPSVRSLRDVSIEQLKARFATMPERIYKRCLHVIQENLRVVQAAQCFRSADLAGIGPLMRESHISLRDLYEVSSRELDAMVEVAEDLPGFIGGRMTGGGFGGCTVNLVDEKEAAAFAMAIAERYRQRIGITPEIYVCSSASGAEELVEARGSVGI